ncbi:MAG TPA: hypothetical protein VL574_17825 [Stellaceae bacterium]|jgi:hypothetical protein|nr:hypothetical protein [Stellaceae bacterium]
MNTTIDIDGTTHDVSVDFGGYIAGNALSATAADYVRSVVARRQAASAIAARELITGDRAYG